MENKSEQPITFDVTTERLLEQIKKENIAIHPTVWELLGHILSNKIYAINLTMGDFGDTPAWIVNAASWLIRFLYKLSGGRGEIRPISYYIQRTLSNTQQMKVFLDRLREATDRKEGF